MAAAYYILEKHRSICKHWQICMQKCTMHITLHKKHAQPSHTTYSRFWKLLGSQNKWWNRTSLVYSQGDSKKKIQHVRKHARNVLPTVKVAKSALAMQAFVTHQLAPLVATVNKNLYRSCHIRAGLAHVCSTSWLHFAYAYGKKDQI